MILAPYHKTTHCFLCNAMLALAVGSFGGCRATDVVQSYQTVPSSTVHKKVYAQQLNERGLACAQSEDWGKAEEAFREALQVDVSCAAAHNNLGLVLMEQGRFYEAACEFSMAGKLDRTAAEPGLNLARLYEVVGLGRGNAYVHVRGIGSLPNTDGLTSGVATARAAKGVNVVHAGLGGGERAYAAMPNGPLPAGSANLGDTTDIENGQRRSFTE